MNLTTLDTGFNKGPKSPGGARTRLLQPENLLATVRKSSGGRAPPQIILETECIDRLATDLCIQWPYSGLEKLPIIIYAVLGNNNYGLRALHTDWLIHYFENWDRIRADVGSVKDIYKRWRPPVYGPHADQLRYVSDTELFKLNQLNQPEGVYIWPTPYQVEEADGTGGKQNYLCFVVYAHGGPLDSLLVDYFAAVMTSKLVLFKEQEKDKLRTFIKALNNEELPPFTSFVSATRQITLASQEKHPQAMEAGWESFIKVLREKGSIEKTGNVTLLPTLNSIATYLTNITNDFNTMPEITQLAPTRHVVDNGRRSKQRQLEYDGNSGPGVINGNDLFVESFKIWVETEIRFSLTPKMVSSLTGPTPDLVKALQLLQSVITVYCLELQNMFDNYVCFAGRLDEKQLIRLQKEARIREQSSWEKAEVHISPKVLSVLRHLEEEICNSLARRVLDENFGIVKYETKLANLVRDNLVKSYTQQMRKYINAYKKGSMALDEADFDVIHHRMWKRCREVMNHCLDYDEVGGKINQVLLDQMLTLEQKMRDSWLLLRGSIKIAPAVFRKKVSKQELSDDDDDIVEECNHLMMGYMADVKNSINAGFCDPENLEDLHSHTMQKYFGDAPTALKVKWGEISARLYTFLKYTWEQYNETLDGNGDDDASHPLVVYLTDAVMKLLVRKANGLEYVTFKETNTTSCPAEIALKRQGDGSWRTAVLIGSKAQKASRSVELNKGEWHGTVFDCIRAAKDKPKFASDMMYSLLQYLSKTARKHINEDSDTENAFTSLVIIVPSWFSLGDHTLLRNAATLAQFRRMYLLNESSLAAYHSLAISGHLNQGTLAVVVIAREDTVQVEIFQEQEPKRIFLLALTCAECTYLPGTRRPSENYVGVLQDTYSRALRQLPESFQRTSGKECLILTEYQDWKPVLEKGLQMRDKSLTVRKDPDVQGFVGAAAIKLGRHTSKVRTYMVDHIQIPGGQTR